MSCVFCERVASNTVVADNNLAAAFPDAFPISPGHTLIAPRRHEADFFNLSEIEQAAVWSLIDPVRHHIESTHHPDAYNIGINAGEAAGQTVPHAHLHVIPWYKGDVQDPRGGIRWIVPTRARYWIDPDD